MKNLFNYDSKFMTVATKISNLLWLGVLTFLCCVPVVTAGAAITAMYYVCFQMREKDSDNVLGTFLRGLRTNFLKATLLWLPVMAVGWLLIADLRILTAEGSTYSFFYKAVTCLVAFLALETAVIVLPMQARFENSWINIVTNSFVLGLMHLPGTVAVMALHAAPLGLLMKWPKTTPAVLMLGLSVPAYLSSAILLRMFRAHTPGEREEQPETPAAEPAVQGGES